MGFGGLYTSISGLQASRYSLNTVSHNISNANNPNYVRQSVIHTNSPYRSLGDNRLQIGTGVQINEIRQIRDGFLDNKLRREMPTFGYYYAKSQTLEDIEGVFNEITDSGPQKVMNDMWNNWNELFKEPESLTIRGLVHESAVAFTDTVNHISNQLNDIKQNLNSQILTKVGEVNNLLEGISKMNQAIKVVEGEGGKVKANDYRDERNALIDRLSELIPVTTYEDSYGGTIVSLYGKDLVNGNYISKLDVKTDPNENTGLGHIYWEKSDEKINLSGKGQLGGFIDVRDKSLVEYMNRLDVLVGTMADEINALHKTGFGLNGETNIHFFDPKDGPITAANIKVNPELSKLNKIAVSKSLGSIGDGSIAKDIYEIRNKSIFTKFDPSNPYNLKPDGTPMDENDLEFVMNIDNFYRDLTLKLSLEREESRLGANNQGFLIRSLDEKRQGLSSVSLDEEMADMIKFQHSYSANSRVINTLDEMIDTVVNRLGIVGR